MAKLGIVTIGQAPRDDIAALFAAQAPAGTEVVLRGALDGLSYAEVDTLQPENGADTLYTRLRGGREVPVLPLICLDDTDPRLAARAGVEAAESLKRLGQPDDARRLLQEIATRFPDTEFGESAK